MREVFACLVALALIAACAKSPAANAASAPASAPAAAPAPAVSGVYTAGGQPATLTDVAAYSDEPFDGQPVTALVFSVKPQSGDANALSDAHQGELGDAIIVRVQAGGVVIGADLVHHGLDKSGGYLSAVGLLSLKDYTATGGELSGRLTSDGPNDAGSGQTVNVDLTFHTKAP
jgi:hypothetical protein